MPPSLDRHDPGRVPRMKTCLGFRVWQSEAVILAPQEPGIHVGCSLCMEYAATFPEKVVRESGFITGRLKPKQLEDLLRHAGSSRSQSQGASAFHRSQHARASICFIFGAFVILA